MAKNQFELLDTSTFTSIADHRESFAKRYSEMDTKFSSIVNELLSNWHGEGANEFLEEAKLVDRDLSFVFDRLKTMCDILEECKELFNSADKMLEEYNKNSK